MNDPAEAQAIRKALYVLFARLFAAPPDAAFYRRLTSGGLASLARAQGLALVDDLCDPEDADASSAELQAEYERLFAEVSLRASDYPGSTGDPVAATAGFLREHALRVDDAAGLPADHFSVALGIMGALAEQAEAAARRGEAEAFAIARTRERAFLLRHVVPWSQSVLAEVASRADRAFYRSLAAMTSAFLESERRRLAAA